MPPQASDEKDGARKGSELEPQRQLCQRAEGAEGAAQCVLPPDEETPGGCGNAEPKAHAGGAIQEASMTGLKVVLLVYREQFERVPGHESPVEEKEVGYVEGRVEDKRQGCKAAEVGAVLPVKLCVSSNLIIHKMACLDLGLAYSPLSGAFPEPARAAAGAVRREPPAPCRNVLKVSMIRSKCVQVSL